VTDPAMSLSKVAGDIARKKRKFEPAFTDYLWITNNGYYNKTLLEKYC
jgi:hypothetical protein